jgi:heterotetrameric sarcosine oxidase gamma subunit
MVERASALEGHNAPRQFGLIGSGGRSGGGPGIHLSERHIASAWLVAAWPQRLAATGATLVLAAGVAAAPGPGASATGPGGTLLRVEPLKWLLISEHDITDPSLDAADGTVLDLSHARTVIHVTGSNVIDLMARMVPLDLRLASFPEGSVTNTALHHLGVTILARDGGFDILVLRSFGLALWQILIDSAAQFGAEIA